MRIFKVIMAVAITVAAIKSCDIDIPYVSRESLEVAQNETRDAKQALQSVQENYARQNRELSSILAELTELSCRTTDLHLNSENGDVQLTQAERIDNNLDAIRSRIDRLEKEADRARKLDKDMALSVQTIKKLRTTVANQQKEIDRLRTAVSDRDATISQQNSVIATQKDTIYEQLQTILHQKEELKRSLDRQTEMVYQAGCDFERLGDEGDRTLDVKGKKDKEMVRAYKRSIYEKAGQLYHTAANMDHAAAQGRCEVIAYKISSL